MRLIEDLPTRRVFEERGDEARWCIPERTLVNNEAAHIVVLLVVIAVVAATFALDGLKLIQQGDTTARVVLVALITTLISVASALCIVGYLWRLHRKAKNRVIRYIFDLAGNTLDIEDTESSRKTTSAISQCGSHSFFIEFAPSCCSVTLPTSYSHISYTIYQRNQPPPPEFIDALKMIGLQELNKQEKLPSN